MDGTLDAEGSKKVSPKMAFKNNLGGFWPFRGSKGGQPGFSQILVSQRHETQDISDDQCHVAACDFSLLIVFSSIY